ncbi:MAG TPA: class I SAM-dependent methyltransferase [Gemmatimonadota bacterium]|nr:class I SAM-dependent methyltransferase [Gemmatimonadota bacterium]
MASVYDAMAETYDEIHAQPFYITQYETYAEDLLDRLADWRGRVLDLGCGTGIHTRAVAELADWAVGIDVSPRLVRKAQVKLRGARGSVVVADAGHMPFADATFDAALSYGEPLSHIEDPGAVLAELARVMRPGGRAILSVDNEWNLRTLTSPKRFLRAATSRGGAVRDWEFYDDGGLAVRLSLKTFTHSELAGLLSRNGFQVEDSVGIHVFTLLVPLATDARADDWRARAFRVLHRLDRRLADRFPFNRLGYSRIVAARRI